MQDLLPDHMQFAIDTVCSWLRITIPLQALVKRWSRGWQAYRRCAHALGSAKGPKALFLQCYATYIAGERLREQKRAEAADRETVTTNQVDSSDAAAAQAESCHSCNMGSNDRDSAYFMFAILLKGADATQNTTCTCTCSLQAAESMHSLPACMQLPCYQLHSCSSKA